MTGISYFLTNKVKPFEIGETLICIGIQLLTEEDIHSGKFELSELTIVDHQQVASVIPIYFPGDYHQYTLIDKDGGAWYNRQHLAGNTFHFKEGPKIDRAFTNIEYLPRIINELQEKMVADSAYSKEFRIFCKNVLSNILDKFAGQFPNKMIVLKGISQYAIVNKP